MPNPSSIAMMDDWAENVPVKDQIGSLIKIRHELRELKSQHADRSLVDIVLTAAILQVEAAWKLLEREQDREGNS